MNRDLLNLFERSERRRKAALGLLKDFSLEKFHSAPARKWTASQIFAHLIQAERISLEYMKKKFPGIGNAGDTGVKEDFIFFLLRTSQRVPLKYKAPAVLGADQPPTMSPEEITIAWDTLRNELAIFLEGFDETMLYRKVYRHAIVGRLNVRQAMIFFDEHLIHHLPQIKRLL